MTPRGTAERHRARSQRCPAPERRPFRRCRTATGSGPRRPRSRGRGSRGSSRRRAPDRPRTPAAHHRGGVLDHGGNSGRTRTHPGHPRARGPDRRRTPVHPVPAATRSRWAGWSPAGVGLGSGSPRSVAGPELLRNGALGRGTDQPPTQRQGRTWMTWSPHRPRVRSRPGVLVGLPRSSSPMGLVGRDQSRPCARPAPLWIDHAPMPRFVMIEIVKVSLVPEARDVPRQSMASTARPARDGPRDVRDSPGRTASWVAWHE